MKAFITGINGQDGSYLSELLIEKGYEVHGLIRRQSEPNTNKISHLSEIKLHFGDMTDSSSLHNAISLVRPDEIYNFAAMSHVKWSFSNPTFTSNVNHLGFVNILEACRTLNLDPKIYQACSSEMFGKVKESPQTENTEFHPQSPYGVSKVAAYETARVYRESYGMNIYCGILFNHESPRRGIEFLSRKVCNAVANISKGTQEILEIGNMDSFRDWGYAKEYAEWIYQIMQHNEPDDFVIATGEHHSVREWIELAFKFVNLHISWKGTGEYEKGYDQHGNLRVKVNPEFYRPAEVNTLLGDYSKSKKILGFEPKVKFNELVEIMVEAEL